MTIGKVFVAGMLGDAKGRIAEPLDAISMLCLYGLVQGEEELELMFPQDLPEKDMGMRILRDMQSFQYFQRKQISSPEQLLKYLYKKHIHYSIWRNRSWLRSKMPEAHVRRGFLYYSEKKNGEVVEVKVWLYGYKMLFAKPKTYVECILDDLKIVD